MTVVRRNGQRVTVKTCIRCDGEYVQERRGADDDLCPECSAFLDDLLSPERSRGITEWFFRTAVCVDFTPDAPNHMPSYKEIRRLQRLPDRIPCSS